MRQKNFCVLEFGTDRANSTIFYNDQKSTGDFTTKILSGNRSMGAWK